MTDPTAAAEPKSTAGDPDSNGSEAPTELKPSSPLERLREQYDASTEDRREVISIAPGRFSGNLAARYAPIPWSRLRRMQRKFVKGGASEEAELNYIAKVIVEACETIMVRMDDGGDLMPLHESVDRWKAGGAVRFDERLAEVFGIDARDPVSICRLVFKNPQALNDHYVDLDAFLTEAAEADEDDDGEGRSRPT